MLIFDGDKLKTLRKKKGLTQTELAQAILGEPKPSHISNYENGTAKPPADVLLNLMGFFKVRAEQLSQAREVEGV